jgi:hypothetical protein
MPARVSAVSARSARVLAVILLLLATLAFGIGIAIEKSEEGEHSGAAGVVQSEETILGIEAESTPLIVLGLAASLVAAAGLWWFGDRRWVLGLVALFCLGFAVLDGIEVSRKWGDEATIAVLALLALVLHADAAASQGCRRANHVSAPEVPRARSTSLLQTGQPMASQASTPPTIPVVPLALTGQVATSIPSHDATSRPLSTDVATRAGTA